MAHTAGSLNASTLTKVDITDEFNALVERLGYVLLPPPNALDLVPGHPNYGGGPTDDK